jgi:hypothetical protein
MAAAFMAATLGNGGAMAVEENQVALLLAQARPDCYQSVKNALIHATCPA